MLPDKLTSDYVVWSWQHYCDSVTGKILPLNILEHEGDTMVVGYECTARDAPVICRNGERVRRVTLHFTFPTGDTTWS